MMRLIPDRLFLEGKASMNHYMIFMKNREPSKIFNFYSNDDSIFPFYFSLIFTIWLLPFSFAVSYGFLLWLIFHIAVSISFYHQLIKSFYAEFYEPEQIFVFIEHTASINKWKFVIIERLDGDKVCITNKFHGGWGGNAILDYRYSDKNQDYLHKFDEHVRDKIEDFCSKFGIPIVDVSGKRRYKPSSEKSNLIMYSIAIIAFIALFYFYEIA